MEKLINSTAASDILGGVFPSRRRNRGFRMAPLIDVTFLLLIFFLVAAKWRPKEDFLPMRVSAATAGTLSPMARPEPLIIQITQSDSACSVQVGNLEPIVIREERLEGDIGLLTGAIQETLTMQKRYADDPIEIICAAEVRWEHLTRIYNVLYGMGLTDITFQLTEQTQDASMQ